MRFVFSYRHKRFTWSLFQSRQTAHFFSLVAQRKEAKEKAYAVGISDGLPKPTHHPVYNYSLPEAVFSLS